MKNFQNSYLIQRLTKPIGRANPFSFGGGLKNGGLSDNNMELLTPLFSFDYMGAAEFEYGVIPKFFNHVLTNAKKYKGWKQTINKTDVFVIGDSDFIEEINERLVELANNKCFLKEHTGFDSACGLNNYYPKDKVNVIGWLELNNHFFFFTDENAYNGICSLFEITQS